MPIPNIPSLLRKDAAILFENHVNDEIIARARDYIR